jgi:AcrR family transcriptional regulator
MKPEPPPGQVPADLVARLGPVILRTFSQEDFHRVDMRTIAHDAGMSFATIYRHFGDKETLLFWFIAHWLRELYPAALAVLDSEESALERMKACLLAHLRFYEERPEVGRIIFMTVPLARWMRDGTYRAHQSAGRMLEVIAEGQARAEIRSDVSTVHVFDAWLGIFNRAFLMWEYRGRSYSLTGEWEPLCKILSEGIAPPRAVRSKSQTARRGDSPRLSQAGAGSRKRQRQRAINHRP